MQHSPSCSTYCLQTQALPSAFLLKYYRCSRTEHSPTTHTHPQQAGTVLQTHTHTRTRTRTHTRGFTQSHLLTTGWHCNTHTHTHIYTQILSHMRLAFNSYLRST